MANQLHTNPWVLDTADSAVILHTGWVHIATMQWSGYNSASDRCSVQDGRAMSDSSGPTTLFDFTGAADLSPIAIQPGQNIKISDFILAKLDSGKLTVWLE